MLRRSIRKERATQAGRKRETGAGVENKPREARHKKTALLSCYAHRKQAAFFTADGNARRAYRLGLAPVAVAASGTTLGITTLAVAAITESTTATTFTAGGTVLARLGFVHADRTTMQILVIQSRDSSLGLLSVRHFHEAEAPRLARKLINNDAGRRNRTIRFKGLTKVTIGGPVRKIPNEYIHSNTYSTYFCRS